jgi:hypothetical protein
VFLASLGAPFRDDFLSQEIFVVQNQKNLGGLLIDFWLILTAGSDEAFNTTEDGLLMSLRCTNLD